MTLRWIEFERAARKLLREEIRASSRLKTKARSAKLRSGRSPEVILVCFLFGMLTFATVLPWRENGLSTALASISIPLTAFSFIYFRSWLFSFYNAHQLTVLTHLPLSDEIIWRVQWKRKPLAILPLFITVFFIYLLIALIFDASPWTAAIALPQAAVIMALAVHLAAYPPRAPLPLFGVVMIVGWTCGSFLLRDFINLEATFPFLAFLPTSWSHFVLKAAAEKGWSTQWLWIAPILLLLSAVPHSLKRIRAQFLFALGNAFSAEGQAEEDLLQPEPPKIPVVTASGEEVIGPTALIEATLSGEALAAPRFKPTDLIESFALRWFTPREALIAGFLWLNGPRWTATWKKSSIALAVCAALVLVSREEKWIFFAYLIGLAMGCGALPILRHARGMELWQLAPGVVSSLYSGFPIAYDELVRTLAKANLIRFVAALPIWIAYGTLVGGVLGNSFLRGAEIAFKTWIIVTLLQPIIIARWLSDSIAMTKKGGELILVVVLLSVFVVLPLFVATLARYDLNAFWGLTLALALISFSTLLLHRRLYRKHGLDCLAVPRGSQ
jgi:hypothetical protein